MPSIFQLPKPAEIAVEAFLLGLFPPGVAPLLILLPVRSVHDCSTIYTGINTAAHGI